MMILSNRRRQSIDNPSTAFRDALCALYLFLERFTANVTISFSTRSIILIAVIIARWCVMMHVDVWRQFDYGHGQAASLQHRGQK